MGERWLPYAAAALATGSVALIMGALALPVSPNGTELLSTLQATPDRWLLASAAFMYAAFALTIGIPTFLPLLTKRGRGTGQVGMVIFAFGTIGTAGYAALLILFRALTVHAVVGAREIDLLSRDRGLIIYLGGFLLAFQAGLLLLGVALLMAGTVPRWVPLLMIGHVALAPVVHLIPEGVQAVHSLILAVALIGVAVSANESSSGVSRRGKS